MNEQITQNEAGGRRGSVLAGLSTYRAAAGASPCAPRGTHVCVSVLPGWFSVFVGCAVSLPACCVSKGSQEVGMSEVFGDG